MHHRLDVYRYCQRNNAVALAALPWKPSTPLQIAVYIRALAGTVLFKSIPA
jgi:hypothetical protein